MHWEYHNIVRSRKSGIGIFEGIGDITTSVDYRRYVFEWWREFDSYGQVVFIPPHEETEWVFALQDIGRVINKDCSKQQVTKVVLCKEREP